MMAHLLFQHFKGILSCIAYAALVVFVAAVVKAVKGLDILLIQLVSRAFTVAALLPIIVYKYRSLIQSIRDRLLTFACGVIHAFSSYMDAVCYRYQPLAIAMILASSQQAITASLGRIILKERLDIYRISGIALSLVGVIATCKLHEMLINGRSDIFSSKMATFGFAAGIIGSIGRSFLLILLRKAKATDVATTTFNMGISATIFVTAIYCPLGSFRLLRCNWESFILLALSLCFPLILALRAVSTQYEDVAIVSVVTNSSQLVVSLCVQMLIFHDNPDIFVVSGAVLFMLSVLVISLGRWLQTHRNYQH